jgi:hypothetical protein
MQHLPHVSTAVTFQLLRLDNRVYSCVTYDSNNSQRLLPSATFPVCSSIVEKLSDSLRQELNLLVLFK